LNVCKRLLRLWLPQLGVRDEWKCLFESQSFPFPVVHSPFLFPLPVMDIVKEITSKLTTNGILLIFKPMESQIKYTNV